MLKTNYRLNFNKSVLIKATADIITVQSLADQHRIINIYNPRDFILKTLMFQIQGELVPCCGVQQVPGARNRDSSAKEPDLAREYLTTYPGYHEYDE